MATLTEVVRKRRQSGQGITQSLGGGFREKLKEKFDFRQMFKQDGLLTALFPQLKAFKATGETDSEKRVQRVNADIISTGALALSAELSIIETNTEIAAKNSMVLPILARDMNVMRQNVATFIKALGIKPTNKADRFFKTSRERETEYETEISKTRAKPTVDDKPEDDKSKVKGFLSTIGTFFTSIISSLVGVIKTVFSSIFSVFKFLIGTVLTKVLSLVSGLMLSVLGVFSSAITKLMSSLIGIFAKLSLGLPTILGRVLLLNPKILIATLIAAGLYQLAADYKKGRERSDEARRLEKIIREGTATPEQVAKFVELVDEGAFISQSRSREEASKSHVDKETAEFILTNIISTDPEDQKLATEELNRLGVSLEVLREYYEIVHVNKDAKKKAGVTLATVAKSMGPRQSLVTDPGNLQTNVAMETDDQFFSDVNAPSMTSPEPQPTVTTGVRSFNVNQASTEVKDQFSMMRESVTTENTQSPQSDSPAPPEGSSKQNLPTLSNVFDMEFLKKSLGNQKTIFLTQ